MTTATAPRPRRRTLTPAAKRIVTAVAVVVVLAAMLFGTKIVPKGAHVAGTPVAFDATTYGKTQFPQIQKYLTGRAVDATVLGDAIAKDQTAAAKQYGVVTSDGATTEVAVKFTGRVGTIPSSGYTPIAVSGLPSGTQVALQLGPAVVGTDLRDANGKVQLGQFENQIQYQDAGDAINTQLKQQVLDAVDAPTLSGKTITVVGVFPLVNPKQWNVTPASIQVQR